MVLVVEIYIQIILDDEICAKTFQNYCRKYNKLPTTQKKRWLPRDNKITCKRSICASIDNRFLVPYNILLVIFPSMHETALIIEALWQRISLWQLHRSLMRCEETILYAPSKPVNQHCLLDKYTIWKREKTVNKQQWQYMNSFLKPACS